MAKVCCNVFLFFFFGFEDPKESACESGDDLMSDETGAESDEFMKKVKGKSLLS